MGSHHHDLPRNWPIQRKIYDGLVILFFEFYTTVISTTGPSAAEEVMAESAMSRVVTLTGFQFMHGIGQAIGGLVMPPCSEALGRRMSYWVATAAYAVACILIAAIPSPAGVFIGLFISGWASSVPSIVLAASIEDQYAPKPRLWMLWLWNCSPILGLCVGPMRWVYWTSAITCGVLFFMIILLRESRPTTLLARRFEDLQSRVGNLDMETPNPDQVGNTKELLQVILIRPAKLGVTEPIIMLVAALNASVWGMLYAFTESFTVVFSGFAATEFSFTLSGYIADSYTIYASSGMAVVAFLRAIAAGCMPLFAYPMYSGLGSNVATSIIAAIATAFCFTPWVFLKYGKKLRESSKFARYSAEVNKEHGAD
ncbi:major facilitator superfamily domain-containing protein [Aspergillus crustosus]